jgi:Tol biopolymer transport system component
MLASPAGSAPARGTQIGQTQFVIGNDSPDWSRAHGAIAFATFRNGLGDIYRMSADGRSQVRLTTHPAHDDRPAWSPDGTQIAFVSTRDGNPEIYVMNADGSGQRRLTSSSAREYFPTWSPDGTRIAYQSDRGGLPSIYSIAVDGTDERRLTGPEAVDQTPDWGPDGRIVFSSNRTVGFTLHVMNADGSGLRKVSSSPASLNELEPTWSPSGEHIAFVSTRDGPVGNAELYIMDAAGEQSARLTAHWGWDAGPSWAPDGRSLAFSRGPSALRPEIHVLEELGAVRKLTATRVQFRVAELRTTPRRPVAGRRLQLSALVVEPTGDPVERGTVECRATVGGRQLRATVRRFRLSELACAWTIPANMKNKRLRVQFVVRSDGSQVARTLQLVVQ